jgi:PEP-CTERM motif
MKSKAITATLMAVVFVSVGTPRLVEATTITDVTVTITSNGSSVIANANSGWTFPVTLGPGEDLVLTQNTGPSGPPPHGAFSFDTSDFAQPLSDIAVSVTADGVTTVFFDVLGVLTLRSVDPNPAPGSHAWQEAQPYSLIGTGSGYEVYVAYADTLHTNPCGLDVPAPLIGNPNCLPTPFGDAAFFQGKGGTNTTGSGHCSTEALNCYDAGVVRIRALGQPQQIPEPATIALLGSGIVGLIAARRRQRKPKSRNEL